MQYVDTSLDSL